jgi:hypothetical protein
MDFNRFTEKLQEAFRSAQTLAVRNGHQDLTHRPSNGQLRARTPCRPMFHFRCHNMSRSVHTITNASRFAMMVQLLGLVFGQETTSQISAPPSRLALDIEVRKQRALVPGPGDSMLAASWQRLRELIRKGSWDPRAEYLYESAIKATSSVVFTEQMTLRNRATNQDSTFGDVVLIEWEVQLAGARLSSLVLEDTSIESRYLLRVNNISTVELLEMLPKLVPKYSWFNMPLLIEVSENPGEIGARFQFHFMGSNNAWAYDYSLSGIKIGADAFVAITFGKGLLRPYYGDNLWIGERIPPLRESVRTWSDNLTRTSSERDNVLMAEFMRRNPSNLQLMWLLKNAATNPLLLDRRYGQIRLALEIRDPISAKDRINTFALESLAFLNDLGAIGKGAAWKAFPHDCGLGEPVWESTAVESLRSEALRAAAIRYLSRCAASEEALKSLESLSLTDDEERARQFAVGTVRSRINERKTK